MKIINPDDFAQVPLTVDSTLYSADNDVITADATLVNEGVRLLKIIPREPSNTVRIEIYNELKEETYTEVCVTTFENGYMNVFYNYTTFEEGDSLEIKVSKEDGTLLWRGKGFVTTTEDLQNYKLINKDDNNVIKF